MGQPIQLEISPRSQERENQAELSRAPEKYAEATLAGYELLQALHDAGVLEAVRSTAGGSSKILEQAVVVASGAEAIRATRNLLLLVRALAEIDPVLLSDLTRAAPTALAQANHDEARPPGLMKLVRTFLNRDFRRGLATFNDLLIVFGKNLSANNSH